MRSLSTPRTVLTRPCASLIRRMRLLRRYVPRESLLLCRNAEQRDPHVCHHTIMYHCILSRSVSLCPLSFLSNSLCLVIIHCQSLEQRFATNERSQRLLGHCVANQSSSFFSTHSSSGQRYLADVLASCVRLKVHLQKKNSINQLLDRAFFVERHRLNESFFALDHQLNRLFAVSVPANIT
mmetsp:Transcript_7724/g.28966  ORF Transcript_7724/g.28966 Transcript_7724/m.28966 type:complete len:181 (-) Transcript_7724:1668-2210(-)